MMVSYNYSAFPSVRTTDNYMRRNYKNKHCRFLRRASIKVCITIEKCHGVLRYICFELLVGEISRNFLFEIRSGSVTTPTCW